jgi:GNAT superfamily N-acetyltransferase
MNIRIAITDKDVDACYPVMRELRPHIEEDHFLAQIRRQESTGFRLAMMEEADCVVAVTGFRVAENLAWGRYLYVDDLVTLPARRSNGFGAALLSWLKDYARAEGCSQLHLDSGAAREHAHRFYEREGMTRAGFHFAENIMSAENV